MVQGKSLPIMRSFLVLIAFVLAIAASIRVPPLGRAVKASSDKVTSLPGIGPMKTNTYSGYMPTNDQGYLYYFFIESFGHPSTDPVILWLQGGPGDASTFGAFVENGPYVISGNGSWSINPYAWTTNASLLWIDNPVGTGFSYTTNTSGYVHTEKELAEQLATVLEGFFTLHPQYAKLPFYVFGESYAGKYIPWLAATILNNTQYGLHVNGVGLGDGWVSPYWQTPSNSVYLGTMGRISSAQVEAANITYETFLQFLAAKEWIRADKYDNAESTVLCLQGNVTDIYNIDLAHDTSEPPYLAMIAWLETPAVQSALNVPNATFASGDAPYRALSRDEEKSSLSQLSDVVGNIPVLLYNGQQDYVCNYIGTQNYAANMSWAGQSCYNKASVIDWSVGSDALGYYQVYSNLTRLVVYHAGHILPFDQPYAAHEMLYSWLNGTFAKQSKNC